MDGTFRVKTDIDPIAYQMTWSEMNELKLVAQSGARELFWVAIGLFFPSVPNVWLQFSEGKWPAPGIFWFNMIVAVGSGVLVMFSGYHWRIEHRRQKELMTRLEKKPEVRMKLVTAQGFTFISEGATPAPIPPVDLPTPGPA